MQEFVVFAVAASMCVLCFAVGFVAALNLRIAERTELPLVGALRRVDDAAPKPADAVHPAIAETSFASAPIVPAPPTPVPQAARTFEPRPDVATRPMASPLPQPTRGVQPVGFPPPASPPTSPPESPAKVFLFGEPRDEPVVVPAVPPVPAASQPNPWLTTQHGAPQQLAPAQVELLPRHPQYARSGRRR
jgi:hypothetical protein